MNSQQIINQITCENGSHLGDLCGWSLSGNHPIDRVLELLVKHGLDKDIILPVKTASTGYRGSISGLGKGTQKDLNMYDVTKVDDTSDKIVHCIVRKDIINDNNPSNGYLSHKDVTHRTECKVHFDKEAAINGTKSNESL